MGEEGGGGVYQLISKYMSNTWADKSWESVESSDLSFQNSP